MRKAEWAWFHVQREWRTKPGSELILTRWGKISVFLNHSTKALSIFATALIPGWRALLLRFSLKAPVGLAYNVLASFLLYDAERDNHHKTKSQQISYMQLKGEMMLIVTTPNIEGKKITKYLGLVSASGTAVVYSEE